MRRGLLLVTAVMTIAGTTSGQTPPELARALAQDSVAGRDSFERYCASCHGVDGHGRGPAAAALRATPPDLATLSIRNGGSFPREELVSYLEGDGRSIPAHGTGDMPVWGPIFRGLDPASERVRVRLQNLVAYVESLQLPARPSSAIAPRQASGAQLFRTYCASCHGTDARGAGPLAEVLRHVPPDLTEYAILNGGLFPSERVRQIIDGRHVTAHGDSEMPVWGDAFRREPGGDPAAANARIDALVRYLESIQKRRAE